jgi:hypothetical protein
MLFYTLDLQQGERRALDLQQGETRAKNSGRHSLCDFYLFLTSWLIPLEHNISS